MKRTHEEFVIEVSEKNPKVEIMGLFEGVNKKIQVRCKECGNVWDVRAYHLLEGQGCPVCAKTNSRKNQAKTQEQFVAEIRKTHPTVEVLGQYVNAFTPIRIRCSVCGNEWETKPTNLSRGHGCPKCAKNHIRSKSKKQKSHEEYVHDIQTANPNIEIISRYVNSRSKVQCRCKKCGREWAVRSDMVLVRGCPVCNNKRITKLNKSHEEFCGELKKVNPEVEVLEKYTSIDTKILVKCKKCGTTWNPIPYNLLKGHGCPICATRESAESSSKTQEDFIEEVSRFNPNVEIIGQYVNSKVNIKVRCRVCNHVWMANPSHLVRDRGCPRCAEFLQTSFPEQCLHYYISQIFSDSINSYHYMGKCFDIFIPSLRTAIEYDGLMWHKNIIKDAEKMNCVKIIR